MILASLHGIPGATAACPTGGDVTITSSCTLNAGTYNYNSLTIDGATVTANGDTSQDSSSSFGGVKIIVDNELHNLGDKFNCLYSSDQKQIGKEIEVVKGDHWNKCLEIKLPPQGRIIFKSV